MPDELTKEDALKQLYDLIASSKQALDTLQSEFETLSLEELKQTNIRLGVVLESIKFVVNGFKRLK